MENVIKTVPYSLIREAEEIAKASGKPFRECLEFLYNKVGAAECPSCKEKAQVLLTARTR